MSATSKSTPSAWYAPGLRFECTGCGACCRGEGYVWVGEQEIERLARMLGLGIHEFGARYLRRVGSRVSLVDGQDGACVFWADGCSVYSERPKQCRTFPFWRDNLRSRAAWEKVAEESPGVNQGRLFVLDEIELLADGEGQTDGDRVGGNAPTNPVREEIR